jgi:CO/xanthine dehydrogenase FAD-binding subunit
MKTAPFQYARPSTLDEACALLAGDPEARLIAGGQTLIPMMAMRLARPSRLIDIARLAELRGITEEADAIVFGAATRQVEAERSALVARKLPLLAAALPWVGHAPTRARGTIGGTIANADPAAEIPLVLATLGGSVTVREGRERRKLTAADLFLGPMTTAISAAGCVVEARFPTWRESRVGVGFHEVSARRSDFAYVAAAAQVALDEAGRCTRLALGIGGATPVPTRLDAVETALKGQIVTSDKIRAAVTEATKNIEIMRDSHATDTYRRRVAIGLAERAVLDALNACTGGRA